MPIEAELVDDRKATLGEGPLWIAERNSLFWVDIMESRIHAFAPDTGENATIDVGQHVGAAVARRSGGLILALRNGFGALDLETGKVTLIRDPESDRPGNRFNDGKCDPAGRFWAGTMAYDFTPGAGSLYRLDTDLSVSPMIENVTISNGMAWTADLETFYYIDTPTSQVRAFDYDVTSGAISNGRVAIDVDPDIGHPDGMSIDSVGNLWVALWGGWKVGCWNPSTNELLQTVSVQAEQVSSCAFGGASMNELYITTAREGLSKERLGPQPHAGGLFRARLDVLGPEAFSFAG